MTWRVLAPCFPYLNLTTSLRMRWSLTASQHMGTPNLESLSTLIIAHALAYMPRYMCRHMCLYMCLQQPAAYTGTFLVIADVARHASASGGKTHESSRASRLFTCYGALLLRGP